MASPPPDPATYEKVHQEADRLQLLVADLQELSRVESHAYSPELKPVAVSTLVQTAVARLSPQFVDKGVTLTTELAPGLPPVLADESRTGQVLLNLLGNALHYTPEGGTIRAESAGAGLGSTFHFSLPAA